MIELLSTLLSGWLGTPSCSRSCSPRPAADRFFLPGDSLLFTVRRVCGAQGQLDIVLVNVVLVDRRILAGLGDQLSGCSRWH